MKTGWPNATSQCGQSSSEVVFAYLPEFNYSSFDISSQIYDNYKVDFNFSPWLQMNYYVTKMGEGGMGFKKLDEN